MNPQDQCPEIPREPSLKKSKRFDTFGLYPSGVEDPERQRNLDPDCLYIVQEAGNDGGLAETSSDSIDDNQMAGEFLPFT